MDKPHKNHIISRKKLREFSEAQPGRQDAKKVLDAWYKLALRARWEKFSDIKATFGSADQVGKFIVCDVGGNKYRIVIEVYYEDKVILIRHVLTHSEYDKGQWKNRPID